MTRTEIHTHTNIGSNIRLVDSINTVQGLIDTALDLGLAGLAFTDHECLSVHPKAIKYYDEIKADHPDFKIILGNEIYLVDERPCDDHYHCILLAKDKEGHKILRILSSLAWLNSYYRKGLERVDTLKSDLERYIKANPGHIIMSTACIGGELGKRILKLTEAERLGDTAAAEREHNKIVEFMLWSKDLFKDDFYIETQPGISKDQITVNQRLLSIASAFGVKMVCSSDSHFLRPADRYVHKAFLNSKEGDREVDAFYQDAYLHSCEEMIEKFAKSGFDSTLVEQMFNNTMEIYNKVENYTLFHTQQIPKVEVKDYPKTAWITVNGVKEDNDKYPVLSSMLRSDDKIERYWVNECINKLYDLHILDSDKAVTYLERLEEEADIKKTIGEKLDTNIFAYPVVLQHYINSFWELGSTIGAGRGSSCSGLNHFLLGVTQLNPIEWDLPFWRYLNKDRAELPDIDIDIAPSKRPKIIRSIKEERGANFYDGIEEQFRQELGSTLVATFGTETTKSAIQTACRGYRSEKYPDGIDVDTSQYLSSLIPSERGFLWSLKEVVYGNEEKGRKPVTLFIEEVDNYPGLLDIMMGIEGLVSRRGTHASGVILTDEDPFEYSAFMRSPSGEVCTQYDLHDAEWAGITKYDFLVTEVQDKLTQAIRFLQEAGEIEPELSLREAYDKYLHPNVLPIDDAIDTWKAIQNVTVLDLFQFDSAIGSQAAKKIRPGSMLELADANGLMRLMTGEAGEEQPMDKYVRFKNDISLWYQEMTEWGLTPEEQEVLKPHFARSHGVPPSQEQLMTMLMDENICGFSLKDANAARKIVGKKQMNKIPALHEQILSTAKSQALGTYVWKCGVGPQLGYAFSIIHALAYSFIGFQSAYIATHWNPIYWNTACLVVNSGSLEDTAATKEKGTDYAKVAKAIGSIQSHGIKMSLVNINTSDYGFKPDIKNNRILYGLKALGNINGETIEKIKAGRPYIGIKDFMNRCPLTKSAMINLIKAGAFDEVDEAFDHNRKKIMIYYISQNCDAKKRLTLQNFNGLIQKGLVPKELEMQLRVFNFNKYLKTKKYGATHYILDDISIQFLNRFYPEFMDNVETMNNYFCVAIEKWDKLYQLEMNPAREWIKAEGPAILDKYNTELFKEVWIKYCKGGLARWEMDSLCFYYSPHELININNTQYGIDNFREVPNHEIDYYFKRGGNQIPIYKIRRIAGTVIAKDDTRHSISLLTTTGVVNVKFTRDQYAKFKRQISKVNPDGTKTVVEKSWFGRGNMLVVSGFKRDDTWVCKTYASTNTHHLYHIDDIVGNELQLRSDRLSVDGGVEEDDYNE